MATWGESSKTIGIDKNSRKSNKAENVKEEWKAISEPEGYLNTWKEPTEQGKNTEAMKKAIRVNAGQMSEEQLRKAKTEMELGASGNALSQLADRLSTDSFQG